MRSSRGTGWRQGGAGTSSGSSADGRATALAACGPLKTASCEVIVGCKATASGVTATLIGVAATGALHVPGDGGRAGGAEAGGVARAHGGAAVGRGSVVRFVASIAHWVLERDDIWIEMADAIGRDANGTF